jgi:peroxiredoxin
MKSFITLLCFGAFAVFSFTVKQQVIAVSDSVPLPALPVGKPMADFTLPDRSGKAVTLSAAERSEKIIVVNFWGTWCAPCRLEMPSFEKAYTDSTNRGLLILAVDEGDSREALDGYLKQHQLSFPILIDSTGWLAKMFGIRAYPTSVLLDRDGKVIRVVEGLEPYFAASLGGMIKGGTANPLKEEFVEGHKVAVPKK